MPKLLAGNVGFLETAKQINESNRLLKYSNPDEIKLPKNP
jgi:hypothetical protein